MGKRYLLILGLAIVALTAPMTLFAKEMASKPDQERSVSKHLSHRGVFSLILTAHVKGSGCVYYYAKHEHEAYVTRSDNGARFNVEKIVLHSNIGGDFKSMTCTNTSSCGRTEQEYNLGCRHSCASATATYRGQTWGTAWTCIW